MTSKTVQYRKNTGLLGSHQQLTLLLLGSACLSGPALSAPDTGEDKKTASAEQTAQVEQIEETVITAGARRQSVDQLVVPAQVLDQEALARQSGNTLGAILQNTPGVANASFGPGVGRPVLRGMSGNRVRTLVNGQDSSDLSAMSSDHAPMADPVNAEQIEIIQGPNTLLYGGGAIGGLVNVVNTRIFEKPFSGIEGTVTSTYSSVDNGVQATGLLNAGWGNWVLHLEGFGRQSDDYRVGNNDDFGDKVASSDVKGSGGNIAFSWVDESIGYAGLSASLLNYDYGIPNPDGVDARVKPTQWRYEFRSAFYDIAPGIQTFSNELAYTDYEHVEGTDGVDEGLFQQKTWDFRSILTHTPVGVWQGRGGLHITHKDLAVCHDHEGCPRIPDWNHLPWDGSQGDNLTPFQGYLFSHDSPMPLTKTLDVGVFAVESAEWDRYQLEVGARLDHRTITANPSPIRPASRQAEDYYNDKTFTGVSVNVGGGMNITDEHRLALSLARAQRAPDAEELYWNGEHHATFSFQLPNPDLKEETAYTANLSWYQTSDTLRNTTSVFYYRFEGFIYNELKGFKDPFHGDDVYQFEQRDAYFTGVEWQMDWMFAGTDAPWSLDVFADYVRARLTQAPVGESHNLPRIPPASAGLAINYDDGTWFGRIDTRTFAKQTQAGANETTTDGYTTLNAQVRFQQDVNTLTYWLSLKGTNLTNKFALNHVSYLKRYAPVQGRSLAFEVGLNF